MDNFLHEQVHELAQRIAALERGEKHMTERLESIEDTLKATNKKVDIVSTQLANLLGKIAKWEGKFGAVLFIVGCVWTFLVAAWGSILNYAKYLLGIGPNVVG